MSHKYYFVSLPEPAFEAILEHCVTKDVASQVQLWDGSYLIKVEGAKPSVLSKYKAYDSVTVKVEKALREQDRPEL